jgi:hypothetical protein
MAVHLHSLRTRARRSTRPERRAHAAPSTESAQVARHRHAGGPQDVALYTCGCGYAFEAAVTASVGCPHCGTAQAW